VSQVAAKRKLTLRDERVKVVAHFREAGSVLQGTSTGRCERFDVELTVESDEPEEEIAKLVRLAHEMCFTEHALTGQVEVRCVDRLNGRLLR